MPIDYNSLLIALSFSGIAVVVAVIGGWMSARRDHHLLISAIGLGITSIGLIMMGLRNGRFDLLTLLGPFSIVLIGLSLIYAGARMSLNKANIWPPLLIGAACIVALAVPLLTGYWRLGAVAMNTGVALLLGLCAREYWNAKSDWRTAALTNSGLFMLVASTYALNAVALIFNGEWTRYPVEDTWYDNLNALTTLICIAGVGAMTLTLHFSRMARRHHAEANTDSLTGVLNRRALFERFPENDPIPGSAVMIFDLDHFKLINDTLGHAQGDTSLQTFAQVLEAEAVNADAIARIGGEEFCIVLPNGGRDAAKALAARIRERLRQAAIPGGKPDTLLTASVGLATGGVGETFNSVLNRADAALYKAKSAGRDTLRVDDGAAAA